MDIPTFEKFYLKLVRRIFAKELPENNVAFLSLFWLI
jgi:hypothetical protein